MALATRQIQNLTPEEIQVGINYRAEMKKKERLQDVEAKIWEEAAKRATTKQNPWPSPEEIRRVAEKVRQEQAINQLARDCAQVFWQLVSDGNICPTMKEVFEAVVLFREKREEATREKDLILAEREARIHGIIWVNN